VLLKCTNVGLAKSNISRARLYFARFTDVLLYSVLTTDHWQFPPVCYTPQLRDKNCLCKN